MWYPKTMELTIAEAWKDTGLCFEYPFLSLISKEQAVWLDALQEKPTLDELGVLPKEYFLEMYRDVLTFGPRGKEVHDFLNTFNKASLRPHDKNNLNLHDFNREVEDALRSSYVMAKEIVPKTLVDITKKLASDFWWENTSMGGIYFAGSHFGGMLNTTFCRVVVEIATQDFDQPGTFYYPNGNSHVKQDHDRIMEAVARFLERERSGGF